MEPISAIITIIPAKLLTLTRLTTWEPQNGEKCLTGLVCNDNITLLGGNSFISLTSGDWYWRGLLEQWREKGGSNSNEDIDLTGEKGGRDNAVDS